MFESAFIEIQESVCLWAMRVYGFLVLCFVAVPAAAQIPVKPPALTPAALSAHGSGRATAYAEQNKIITHDGKTHVVWLDADDTGFWVRGRTLDRASGAWGPVITIGPAQDNHGGPALTIDRQGYLHIVYYPHHAPCRYQRSVRPNDLTVWEPVVQFGEGLSYPVMVCAPDDTLILTARRGYQAAEGEPKEGMRMEQELWRKPPGGAWKFAGVLIQSRWPGYSQYAVGLAWGLEGRLHLNARIYEAPEGTKPLNTIGHMMSDDQGRTWKTTRGRMLNLPVNAVSIDRVADNSDSVRATLNSGPLGVDASGVPHLLFTANVEGRSQLYLATPAPGLGWTRRDLRPYLPAAQADWQIDLGMGGGLSFAADGRATIVAVVLPPAAGGGDPLKTWGHPATEVVRFWSDDKLKTFQSELVSAVSGTEAHWLPNLERPSGHNAVPSVPGIIYTAGLAGGGLHDRNLKNEVRWQPVGHESKHE